MSKPPKIVDVNNSDNRIEIGDFFIAPGMSEGRTWIGRLTGPCQYEGGDFSTEKLSALLAVFYDENF